MPGVETSPIGSGSPPTPVSHASPPSASLTSLGAFSWYFSGSQFCQMSGGSRMWQSADRKSTRLNSSHLVISYAVFCLNKYKRLEQGIAGQAKLFAIHEQQVSVVIDTLLFGAQMRFGDAVELRQLLVHQLYAYLDLLV